MAEWPNDDSLNALEGDEVVDCGELVVPTGRLLICDPYAYLTTKDLTLGCRVNVPPRTYPVRVTMHTQVGYASLSLSGAKEVTRKHLLCLLGGAINNVPLPLASDGANVIMFKSGMGDGSYPVVAGYDERGS